MLSCALLIYQSDVGWRKEGVALISHSINWLVTPGYLKDSYYYLHVWEYTVQ